jgi:hypothetical protein
MYGDLSVGQVSKYVTRLVTFTLTSILKYSQLSARIVQVNIFLLLQTVLKGLHVLRHHMT